MQGSLKITFLLPNLGLRGGIRGVIDYSDTLARMGVDVTVVFPTRLRRLPFVFNEIEYVWRAPHKLLFGRWFSTRARLLAVPSLDPRYIPRADVVVATAWQTAEWAATYPADRGERFYFIQDIETYDDEGQASATYKLDFRRIVTSPWIRDELAKRFGAETHALIPYGVDHHLYHADGRPSVSGSPPVRIGTIFDESRRKGLDVALRSLTRLKEQRVPISVQLLGVPQSADWQKICDVARPKIEPAQTPDFYRSCDVWLCPSRSEGFYLPGLEAMACGCALVTTAVGGTVYYALPDRTALVCEPGDEESLTRALLRACTDARLRERLGREGARYVRRFDHRTGARMMLRALNGERISMEPESGLTARHCA